MQTEHTVPKSLCEDFMLMCFFHAPKRATELRRGGIFMTSYVYSLLFPTLRIDGISKQNLSSNLTH